MEELVACVEKEAIYDQWKRADGWSTVQAISQVGSRTSGRSSKNVPRIGLLGHEPEFEFARGVGRA